VRLGSSKGCAFHPELGTYTYDVSAVDRNGERQFEPTLKATEHERQFQLTSQTSWMGTDGVDGRCDEMGNEFCLLDVTSNELAITGLRRKWPDKRIPG
jgi:hypothetical protein